MGVSINKHEQQCVCQPGTRSSVCSHMIPGTAASTRSAAAAGASPGPGPGAGPGPGGRLQKVSARRSLPRRDGETLLSAVFVCAYH